MRDKSALRKVSDDLYEQDFVNKQGKPSVFKWEREFETVRIELSGIERVAQVEVTVAGFPKFEDKDLRKCSSRILGYGELPDGDKFSLIGTKAVEEDHIHRVTLQRYGHDWDALLAEARQEGLDKVYWTGHLWYEAEDDWYVDKPKEFYLDLQVPAEMFDYVFAQLQSPRTPHVTVTAQVGVFRSEVDRSLEEPFHSRDFAVEQRATAIVRSIAVSHKLTTAPDRQPESKTEKSRSWWRS